MIDSSSSDSAKPDKQPRIERLCKVISAYGIASRREAERLIESGRVSVNGRTAETGQKVQAGADLIEIDGIPAEVPDHFVYIMLNKPCGYLTTLSDDRGRKTVMHLLKEIDARIYPVGRLDYNTEGLLLLTNDGDFANSVSHPSNGKSKTYEVRVTGDIKQSLRKLRHPVKIDGREVRAYDIKTLPQPDGSVIMSLTIYEGRNRQIRKMCAACGLRVISLRRVSIGKLELGSLPLGKWRFLTPSEISDLQNVST